MFDFGWMEIAVVAVVAILVIDPKDMPTVLFKAGRAWRGVKLWMQGIRDEVSEIMTVAEQDYYRKESEAELTAADPDPRKTGEEE